MYEDVRNFFLKVPPPRPLTIPSLFLDRSDNRYDFSLSLNDFVGILCVDVKKEQGQPQYVSLSRLAFSLVYILTDFGQDLAVLSLNIFKWLCLLSIAQTLRI